PFGVCGLKGWCGRFGVDHWPRLALTPFSVAVPASVESPDPQPVTASEPSDAAAALRKLRRVSGVLVSSGFEDLPMGSLGGETRTGARRDAGARPAGRNSRAGRTGLALTCRPFALPHFESSRVR